MNILLKQFSFGDAYYFVFNFLLENCCFMDPIDNTRKIRIPFMYGSRGVGGGGVAAPIKNIIETSVPNGNCF